MKKKNGTGILSAILGTLLVILGVVLYAVISSLIDGAFANMRMGDGVAMHLFPMRMTGILISFVLFEAIFIVWHVKASKDASREGDVGGKMKRLLRLVALGCICASLLVSVAFANVYTDCREDSITKVAFVPTKEYRWDERCDVAKYIFSCDEGGGLTFNVIMRDGEVIELFASPASVSDGFREKYNMSSVKYLGYAAHLAESFANSGYIIDGKVTGVENMERIYKAESPDIWAEIEKILSLQPE